MNQEKLIMTLADYPVSFIIPDNIKLFWKYSLVWVEKHQSKCIQNNEHPFDTPDYRKVETFGHYLNSMLELCYSSANLSSDLKILGNDRITSAALWNSVSFEMILGSISTDNQVRTIGLFQAPLIALETSKIIQTEIKMLRSGQNPYAHTKELRCLFDLCLKVSAANSKDKPEVRRKKSQFRRGVWKQFIDSYVRINLKSLSTML